MPQPEHLSAASHLFTVRLWREDLGAGETEWRGQVTHVLSGEAHYFRCWDQLSRRLEAMAERDEPQAPVGLPPSHTRTSQHSSDCSEYT